MFYMNKFMSFCNSPLNLFVNKLTSCHQLMTFAPWSMFIANPIRIDLVSCVVSFHTVVSIVVI